MIDDVNEQDESDDTLEMQERARRMGWVSEEEWDDERAEKDGRKKPAKFLSAKEFVDNAENSMPVLRSQLRKQDAMLSELQKQTKESFEILQEQRRIHAESLERVRREERERLEAEREQYVAEGEVEKFKEVDAKIRGMDKPADDAVEEKKPAVSQEQQRPKHPDIEAFAESEKDWFQKNPLLTNAMIAEFDEVKNERPTASIRENLQEAKARLEQRYPEKFGINPRRDLARRPTGGSGTRAIGSDVESRFAALSQEERAQFDQVVKMVERNGGKITKAEWLKEIGR